MKTNDSLLKMIFHIFNKPCQKQVIKIYSHNVTNWAVQRLGRLFAGFTPLRPGFDPKSGHTEFVVGKAALGQVFFKVLRPPLIPPTVH
jgi:hypothetical protein